MVLLLEKDGLSSLHTDHPDVGFLPTKASATALEEDPPPFDPCCTSRHNHNTLPDYSPLPPAALFGPLVITYSHHHEEEEEDTTDLLLADDEVMEELDRMMMGTWTPPLSPQQVEQSDDFVLFP
ncbi:hypothetical protein K501DRAFT_335178 [Backusella circina FSU 941]|nr:hypothetical protein K501DRAFT_335178 [Backusella circina FSU 941]